ncbi:xanthine dehydrogenase family protein molybdopterin-binding subunit [Pseudomonas sp. GD03721]|nr:MULTISPECIES: xanthine dehydrogenase family protein molybdopterin-binding subunit [Pseudomonas]WGL65307.1 xanthine dehydrogenase family protein molybdopterin-binding subunit [Pseudomonas sp. CW003PS]MDH1440678.1 xanthine dehydrogenase family protein molybdopterin-binding subunit [Pseudomonas sp. GD03722]MDV5863400.1 xanthine dehydrogenase family protein molybdopterin-binding subunit [Pseudomonas mendocina]WGG01529.1 xanthine dehydrogenase family protein molybdopterin-binding subunit [Pseudom
MGKIETPDSATRGILNVSRRTLLKGSGGLALGIFFAPLLRGMDALAAGGPLEPNAFVRIDLDGTVTVLAKHLEMGQGSYTGLATLLAEELDADWDKVRVEGAPADVKRYNNLAFGPMQGTGGSTAMANSWEQMRNAGATAKAMLVAAAAQRWGVPASEISVDKGVVSHAGSGRSAGFGELVEAAASLPVPEQVQLKEPKDFKLIGKRELRRKDSLGKTDGSAIFTQDFKLPGMLVAMVAYPPRFGGVPRSVDSSKAKAVRDVVEVVEFRDLPHGRSGVAVLAKNTWAARQGRDALVIDWDESQAFTLGSEEILAQYRDSASKPGLPATSKGDADAALAKAAKVVEADYEFPYLAHAAMEPMNCLVKLSSDRCEIWNGEQFQTVDQAIISSYLGLKPEQVSLTQLYAGGSFGRRASSVSDYLLEAVAITKAARDKGVDAPVKMVWTREDDTRGGFFRPLYLHRVRIGLDQAGKLQAWHNRIVGQSIMTGTSMEPFMIKEGIDHTSVEGASNLSYAVPNLQVELSTPTNIKVPVLWWRSVGHTHTGYVAETMIDEAAVAAGQDPYAFRHALLDSHPRHRGALELAAKQAGWDKPLAAGAEGEKRGRGIAVHESFGSFVAQVAEVTVKADGSYRLDRVVCAVDCGIAINPDVIKAQMEGGIGFALAAARHSAITLKEGRVEQSNFHDFQVLRMNEMPKVEVYIVPSAENPTGVGEPGVPPLAPALANALFAATGVRLRKLPFPAQIKA